MWIAETCCHVWIYMITGNLKPIPILAKQVIYLQPFLPIPRNRHTWKDCCPSLTNTLTNEGACVWPTTVIVHPTVREFRQLLVGKAWPLHAEPSEAKGNLCGEFSSWNATSSKSEVTYIKKLSASDSSLGESTFVLSCSTGEGGGGILSREMLRKKVGWRIA